MKRSFSNLSSRYGQLVLGVFAVGICIVLLVYTGDVNSNDAGKTDTDTGEKDQGVLLHNDTYEANGFEIATAWAMGDLYWEKDELSVAKTASEAEQPELVITLEQEGTTSGAARALPARAADATSSHVTPLPNEEKISEPIREENNPPQAEAVEPMGEVDVATPAEKIGVPVENKAVTEINTNKDQGLNQYVLDIINTYHIGGGRYPYLLNHDYANYNGVTRNLYYQGKVLLKAHPSGNKASHCVGITFEVFFRAMQERNKDLGIAVDDFNGMNWDNLFDFVMNWYAASGPKRTNNIVTAVERYGVGTGINRLEDVRAGDFIDINRTNGTGHTVVFLNWIKDGERIVGLRYWSSQPSTRGINYNEEYFHGYGNGNVIKNQLYMVRILPVSQYK